MVLTVGMQLKLSSQWGASVEEIQSLLLSRMVCDSMCLALAMGGGTYS